MSKNRDELMIVIAQAEQEVAKNQKIIDDAKAAMPRLSDDEVVELVSDICHDLVNRLNGWSGSGVLAIKRQVNLLADHFGFGGVEITDEDLSYGEMDKE